MFSTNDLTVKYGQITALRDLSIHLEKGELTTLLGANGAGKTTLLKTISGLLKPTKGCVTYQGVNIEGMQPDRIIKMGIAHCPEGRKALPRQTVYENLKMGAYIRNDSEVEQDIERFFEKFPRLRERRDQLAGHLSGGEQQMLVICRALMSRPKILLLDEPSMGLAPLVVKEVFEIIRQIHEEGTTILLVEQNAKMALKIADKGYILEVGEIVAVDDAKSLLRSKTVQESYLGG
ncbi:MAG: ABC transporter ATP-binding protein [Synergistales bacterium]